MSFQEAMKIFEYRQAVQELDLPKVDSLWEGLHHLSCAQDPQQRLSSTQLPELQALHDLSWVLTQIEPAALDDLEQLSRSVRKALIASFGPYVFQCCEKFSVEGLLLPFAKTFRQGIGVVPFLLSWLAGEDLPGRNLQLPSEDFVVSFARLFVKRFIASKFPSRRTSREARGGKIFLGWKEPCNLCNNEGIDRTQLEPLLNQIRRAVLAAVRLGPPTRVRPPLLGQLIQFLGGQKRCLQCHGTGVNLQDAEVLRAVTTGIAQGRPILEHLWENHFCPNCFGSGNWQAGLQTPLPNHPTKTVQDLLLGVADGLTPRQLLDLLGERILCKICSRWLQIPPDAQEGWICPIVDGYGQIQLWACIQWERN